MAKIKGSPKQYGNGNQYSAIQQTGDGAYPPLEIRRDSAPRMHMVRYILLDSYSESYKADWDFSDTSPGDINQKPVYSKTIRTIDISFTLAARNVHEAKKNLDFCQKLAKTVYRDFIGVPGYTALPAGVEGPQRSTIEWAGGATPDYVINFGTFLREQIVKMLSFDFDINFDAGVFDYGSTPSQMIDPMTRNTEDLTVGERSDKYWASGNNQPSDVIKEDSYVYHGDKGGVYPKLVTVKMAMQTDEQMAIGFGGSFRAPESVGWSLSAKGAPRNALLDWPHGTGPIAAAEYCQRTPNDGSGQPPGAVGSPLDPNNEQVVDIELDQEEAEAITEKYKGLLK
jgi:hypothetical protein